jgi:dTDP-4-amino-4,6-dideoxygalactose transaminase
LGRLLKIKLLSDKMERWLHHRDTALIEKNFSGGQQLALHGGTPAVSSGMPAWPMACSGVAAALHDSYSDGSWGQYHGRPLDEFARALREFLNIDHVWTCCSGTIAVELALRGLGVQAGHEVILGGYDFPGNFRAIEAIGAHPVLVDVREGGYVIDPANIVKAASEATRAVIVSHLHGQLADMPAVISWCQPRQIAVLEDACQVPGATVAGRPAGTWGDAGVYSFGGSKLLKAGRGGAVVTREAKVLQRIRIAAERGNDAFPLSALQAAVLTPQLATLPERHQQRLRAATQLREALFDSRLFRPVRDQWNTDWSPAFFKFAVQAPGEFPRQRIIEALTAEGVPVFTGFRGFIRRTARRCRRAGDLQNARLAAEQTILLHHPLLLGDRHLLDQVIHAFDKVDRLF